MDYREKYKRLVEKEQELANLNRQKREIKKKSEKLKLQSQVEALKNHSTGLINWVQKGHLPQWNGYIGEQICFNISQGIYKYSLSVFIETADKKDKNIKTSFNLEKLQVIAESIAKKNI